MSQPRSPADNGFPPDLLYRSECFAEDLVHDAAEPLRSPSRAWLYELTLSLAMLCLPLHMLSQGG